MPAKVECEYCNKKFGYRQIFKHRDICLIEKYKNSTGKLMRFFASDILGNIYMLYAIVGNGCELGHIDVFLRSIWCECCDHMSIFIDDKRNEINDDDFKTFENGSRITYEYDMGSTTTVLCELVHKFTNNINMDNVNMDNIDNVNNVNIDNNIIKLIHRNTKPVISCSKKNCKNNATHFYDGDEKCQKCIDKIKNLDSFEDNFLQIIVNSPRIGICGYPDDNYDDT